MAELEHIGIAVSDLERVLRVLEDVLNVSPYKSEVIEKDRIRTHFLRGGGAKLELLESLDPNSPVARFVDRRGPGLHHLAFEVPDIDAAYRRLSEGGYKPLDDAPRPGADGKLIFFLHPKDTAGVLIELCQTARSTLEKAGTAGGLRIRTTSSQAGPKVTYLHGAEASPPPDQLARILEQSFAFQTAEAAADIEDAALLEGLGTPRGLVASGALAPFALRYAADAGLRALALIDPPDRLWPVDLDCSTLIVGRDGDGLDAALEARASITGSALAVVPGGDSSIVCRLVERHLMIALRTS